MGIQVTMLWDESRADEIILQDLGRLRNWYVVPAAGTGRPLDRVPAAGTGYYDTLYVSGPGCWDSKAPRSSPSCRDRIQDVEFIAVNKVASYCAVLPTLAFLKMLSMCLQKFNLLSLHTLTYFAESTVVSLFNNYHPNNNYSSSDNYSVRSAIWSYDMWNW